MRPPIEYNIFKTDLHSMTIWYEHTQTRVIKVPQNPVRAEEHSIMCDRAEQLARNHPGGHVLQLDAVAVSASIRDYAASGPVCSGF